MKRPKKSILRWRVLFRVQNYAALVILLLCAIAGWWVVTRSGLDWSSPDKLMQSFNHLGWVGVLLYIGFLVLAIVIGPIPSTPVTIAAGAIWNPNMAGVYGAIGIFLGSLTAYFIGRTLGRSAVQALSGKVIYFSKQRGERYLGWIVLITHLIPIMPYDLISYGAGISGLSLPVYASASLLGIIPCTFLLTHVGSALTVDFRMAAVLVVMFVLVVGGFTWGVRRYNWFGLREIIYLK